MYSVCQFKKRYRVSEVPRLERIVRIRQCTGGVCPRSIFYFSSFVMRYDSVKALLGDYHAALAMTGPTACQ
jgi:hypothetical protein